MPVWVAFRVRIPGFALEGKIILEVNLAPHLSYAFHRSKANKVLT